MIFGGGVMPYSKRDKQVLNVRILLEAERLGLVVGFVELKEEIR